MSQTHTQVLPATSAVRPAGACGALAALTATEHDWTQTALRVTLGVVMLPHGAQKLLGAFGGYGFDGTMGFLTGQAGLPWIVAFLVIFIEFFGALALIAGLFSRAAALGVAAVMIGAVATVHLANGFFMNWTGAQAGEGFEYHLLALVISLAVILRGGGAASADRAISARLRS
jgi:putative oxidoreductase